MRSQRRIISLVLAFIIVTFTFAESILNAFAAEVGVTIVGYVDSNNPDFKYSRSNGSAIISEYTGSESDLTIPSALDGYLVKIIGNYAFRGCNSLINVTIPDSVTDIYSSAFENCTNLKRVTIPDSITSIGRYAFSRCSNLESMTIPDSVTDIRSSTFYGCTDLKSVNIGNSVTSIDNWAFSGCENLTKIVIPDSVTDIGVRAFNSCTDLNIIAIPDSVTSIGEYAFADCTGLTDVYYSGTQDQWNDLIGNIFVRGNDYLINANIYFESWDGKVLTSTRKNGSHANERVTVYQNNKSKYLASKGAKIEYNSVEYLTDVYGIASLPSISSGLITVSKNGFISRTITSEQLELSKNVYLEPINDNGPVVTAVWVDNTDVLHDSYPLSMISKYKTTIKAEVEWGKYSYGSIKLWQDGKTASFSGDTLTMVISDQFDTSGTITLIATDSENHKIEKTLLIQNGTVNKTVNVLDGIEVGFNDNINLTLPDNTPLIGGLKVGAGLSTSVPISVSAENGKIYVSVGAQFYHGEWKGESRKTGELKEVKGFVNNFKEAFKGDKDTISELKKFKSTYKNKLKKPKGKFGIDADFTIIGYFEGTFDVKGHITWLDQGLILNPSVSISKDIPFSLGPVPMYFEIGFTGNALGRLNMRLNEEVKKFIPNGEVSGTLALNGGVGFGAKKILYAGGGLEGSLDPDWKINVGSNDYFTLKAKLKAYAKAGIAFFEAKKTWYLAEKTLIEYPSRRSLSATSALLDNYDFYDYSNYSIKDFSYLDSSSSNYGAKEIAPVGTSEGSSLLKSNIYRESTPQYVIFDDGTALAVWLDSNSSDINSVCLYYSFFSGSDWTNPKQVFTDGTLDYAPALVEADGKAYLVWQNATKAFNADDELTLDGIAKDFDISVAVFDSEHQFIITTFINENLDMQPVIYADGNDVCVAWINNSDNDWFGNNTHNSIVFSQLNNNTWSEPQVYLSDLNSIDCITVDYNDGVNIAYVMDTNGDINTTDDMRVYENGVLVGSEELSANSPQYHDHKLYWYSENTILSSDIKAGEDHFISSNNYQLLETNSCLAAVFTVGDGLYSKAMVSYYNAETASWSKPRTLIDNHSFIGAFSADTDIDGNIKVLFNESAVVGTYEDDNPYGTASLMMFEDEEVCDISISEPVFNEESFCENEPMVFEFDITNNGSSTIKGIDAVITDENGTVLNSVYNDDMIVPGETILSSAYYIVDDKYATQNVTITVTPRDKTDTNTLDNTQNASLSYENLCVENLTTAEMENDTISISADVVNYGYQKSNPVTVNLVKDSANGTIVDTRTIDGIESLDMQTVSFEVNETNESVYYVTISCDGDMMVSDNSDFILINSGLDGEENMSYLLGDVDGDDNISIVDATFIQRHLASIPIPFKFNEKISDSDEDGIISIMDATFIQRWLANLKANDNIGKPISK